MHSRDSLSRCAAQSSFCFSTSVSSSPRGASGPGAVERQVPIASPASVFETSIVTVPILAPLTVWYLPTRSVASPDTGADQDRP
jgi:hypothetical protein